LEPTEQSLYDLYGDDDDIITTDDIYFYQTSTKEIEEDITLTMTEKEKDNYEKYRASETIKMKLPTLPYNELFVLKPKFEKRKIEGIGYMVQKLQILEDYYIIQKSFEHGTGLQNYYLSLGNYITNFIQLIELINYYTTIKDVSILRWLIIMLYKFLCNCFITYNQNKEDSKGLFLEKIILFCLLEKKTNTLKIN